MNIKMERPSWDEYFAKIADDVSARSTCVRHKFGSVIINDRNEIVSTGYNGNVRGAAHCTELGYCLKDKKGIASGTGHDICQAVHAEQNALLQAGKLSRGSTLYVNAFPCKICARLIVNAGIARVVTSGSYTDEEGLKILRDADIIVRHIDL